MPDPWFPRYHVRPRSGWINDPNGLIYYDGLYHVFYQWNPVSAAWGDIHWGHAASPDLLHWEDRGIALAPRRVQGEAHCFSGNAAIGPNGRPWLFYTSVGEGPDAIASGAEQWVAVPGCFSSGAETRHRLLGAEEGKRLGLRDWRDPFVWRDRDGWAMATGASRGGRGVVALHRSSDCLSWSYAGILFEDPRVELVECPNFFPLGDRWCLIDSPCGAVRWNTGFWDGEGPFRPSAEGIVDAGGREAFYAPQVFAAPPAKPGFPPRRLMIGWLPESARSPRGAFGLPPLAHPAHPESASWAGALSIPMELSLGSGGRLQITPALELEAAKDWPRIDLGDALALSRSSDAALRARDAGTSFELVARIHGSVAFDLLAATDGSESARLVVEPEKGFMEIDRTELSALPGVDLSKVRTVLPPRRDGIDGDGTGEELRVFVDASIIEAFFRGTRLSARAYPLKEGSRFAMLGEGALKV